MNMRRALTLTLSTVAVATLSLVGMATGAQASTLPTKSERAAVHTAWVAEHSANRECSGRLAGQDSADTDKWERCVRREYKRSTGERMDVIGYACAGSVCGLESAAGTLVLPGKGESGAKRMRTVAPSEYADLSITPSPYGNLSCREYTYPNTTVVLCSNGLKRTH